MVKKAEFLQLIKDNFGPILLPRGFSPEGSKQGVFWRKSGDDIYHIISPSRDRSMDRYSVAVYASSPIVYGDFWTYFPDLNLLNGGSGYLSPEHGISDYKKMFFCRNPEAFATSFNRDTAPALLNIALPYLDDITDMNDLIPTIRDCGMMGPALLHVGRHAEAKSRIESEIRSLERLPRDNLGQVERAISFQRNLLERLQSAP